MANTRFAYTKDKTDWKCTATVVLSCGCEFKVSGKAWDKSIALYNCKKLVQLTSEQHRC